MKKISNSKELNEYYGKINTFIDDYIKSFRVTPTEVFRYISKNMKRFLEKYKIDDIQNIDRIVKDVIEHRKNMERDKVFKFEQFSVRLDESLLSLSPASVEHEKMLADYYNTSLGHIEPIDSEMHLYEIKDFDTTIRSIIFSSDEIIQLKEKIKEKITTELCEMSVTLGSIEDQTLPRPMDFKLGAILSKEMLKSNLESKLDNDTLLGLITTLIPNSIVTTNSVSLVKFKELFNGFYIWEV